MEMKLKYQDLIKLNEHEIESRNVMDIQVPFTRKNWKGRTKSCRAIGDSLPSIVNDKNMRAKGSINYDYDLRLVWI